MSDDQTPAAPPPAETPAAHIASEQKKKNLYRRITSSAPLVVTIVVHVVLGLIAAAVVVQQVTSEKKKTFEASERVDAAPAVEHRLQVARRGGASGGSSSPVSANRIFSTAENALQMPAMPDLPNMGAGGFGGFGGMGSGVGMGAGVGMSTSLGGGTGLGGRGFMSLNFLGMTSQNASKIVFVVDTSTGIMAPAKGGFQAFSIIREEIMRLVGRLPPSAQFNVVLYRNGDRESTGVEVNLFQSELVPATSDNKKEFFTWMTPVNAQLGAFGPYSAAGPRRAWRRQPLPPESGVDPLLLPPVWSRGAHVALEQKPDTIFVITATQGSVLRRVDEETLAKRRAEQEKALEEFNQDMAKEGLDPKAVLEANRRAYGKAARELAEANRKLVAAGKDPIVVENSWRIFDASVQAALKKNGISIVLDKTGWTKKDGSPIRMPRLGISTTEGAEWTDFMAYYARLQNYLSPERPTLNIFLFVGPNDRAEDSSKNLTAIARRNGGTFQLITTKRLEEMRAKEEAAAAKN